MKFSEKLKKLRSDKKLTQDELADKIFVTRTAVSKWETDNGYPSIESLKLLAKLFDTTIDELIGDEDIENKNNLEERNSKTNHLIALIGFVLTVGMTIGVFFVKVQVWKDFMVAFALLGVALYFVFTELSLSVYRDKFLTRKQNFIFKSREIFATILFFVVLFVAYRI